MRDRTCAVVTLLAAGLLAGCERRWDERVAPDISGATALAGVESFVATHGWEMQSQGALFQNLEANSKGIQGLPWKDLKGRSLPAVTQNRILYVLTSPPNARDRFGVAYNPEANAFAASVRGFRPIGFHWYVWIQPENQNYTFVQRYE